MLPAFENLDRWVPKPVRYLLSDWVAAGAVHIQQIQLPDSEIVDSFVREIVDERWGATSPLRRAATGALAYLEAQGRSLRTVHLHGQDIAEEQTPIFVGIGWRYYSVIHDCLTHFGGLEWLEVPRPTLRQPLVGLLVTVLDRTVLDGETRSRVIGVYKSHLEGTSPVPVPECCWPAA